MSLMSDGSSQKQRLQKIICGLLLRCNKTYKILALLQCTGRLQGHTDMREHHSLPVSRLCQICVVEMQVCLMQTAAFN